MFIFWPSNLVFFPTGFSLLKAALIILKIFLFFKLSIFKRYKINTFFKDNFMACQFYILSVVQGMDKLLFIKLSLDVAQFQKYEWGAQWESNTLTVFCKSSLLTITPCDVPKTWKNNAIWNSCKIFPNIFYHCRNKLDIAS